MLNYEYITSITIWFAYFFGPYWTQALFSSILFSKYYFVAVLYLIYMYVDSDSIKKGGKLWHWLRQLSVWDSVHKYFPVTFHKTADLDANKNYIIGCHPHGIAVYGTAISFIIFEKRFQKLFPGITVRVCLHTVLLSLPFLRDFILSLGGCSVHKESIEYIVNGSLGIGNAAAIVIGGGREFLSTSPNKMTLTLKDRKGFVKIALKTGSSLVPCICFGENELFADSTTRFKFIFKAIKKWYSVNKVTLVLSVVTFTIFYLVVNFKDLLNTFSGLEKYRKHLHTIMGTPIEVKKTENPRDEEVDELHQKYIKSLTDLFYENRSKYSKNPNQKLFIE